MPDLYTVSATIVARLMVGPLCDRYGPKRTMAVVLAMGAVSTGLIWFVSNGTGLTVIRFFIGILGTYVNARLVCLQKQCYDANDESL